LARLEAIGRKRNENGAKEKEVEMVCPEERNGERRRRSGGRKGPLRMHMMAGYSESEVAHGERGAHPRQDRIGRVRRV